MYYYWCRVLKRLDPYATEKQRIQSLFHTHQGRYGYRRITLALRREGYRLNHKTVQKLMDQLELKSWVRPKRYRAYRGEVGRRAPNRLQRDFRPIARTRNGPRMSRSSTSEARRSISRRCWTCITRKSWPMKCHARLDSSWS